MPLKNTRLVIFQRLKENILKEILLMTPLKKTLLIIPFKVHSIPHSRHRCPRLVYLMRTTRLALLLLSCMAPPNLVGIFWLLSQSCFQILFSRLDPQLRMHVALYACCISLSFFVGKMLYVLQLLPGACLPYLGPWKWLQHLYFPRTSVQSVGIPIYVGIMASIP